MFLLDRIYLGNTLLSWIIAAALAAGIYTVLRLIKRVMGRRLKVLAERTTTDLDNFVVELVQVRTKKFLLFILAVYWASMILILPVNVERVLLGGVFITLFLQMGLWGNGMINFFVTQRAAKDGEDGLNLEAYSVITWIAKVALWTIVVLLALNNLGIQITGGHRDRFDEGVSGILQYRLRYLAPLDHIGPYVM